MLGNWIENSILKLTFDRIVPGNCGGNIFIEILFLFLIGTYEVTNLQVVLIAVNKAKRDFSNAEAKDWIANYKLYV